jgi:sugar phosphate isomerase/epimerase
MIRNVDKAWEQLADTCLILGREASKYDITIVIEPLNKSETNIINSVAEGYKLAQQVNHPNVKLLADFYII